MEDLLNSGRINNSRKIKLKTLRLSSKSKETMFRYEKYLDEEKNDDRK